MNEREEESFFVRCDKKADGSKFGKLKVRNVWLTADTSVFCCLNTTDADAEK
jgi:hypothetical protein